MQNRYVGRITFVEVNRPRVRKTDGELDWLCRCLGIDPESDRLAYGIFRKLMDASRRNQGVRTIEITKKANVTQAAVVYHMNTFLRSGIVVRKGREYFLRGGTLEETMNELEADMTRRMRMLREMARKIDER